MNNYVVLRLYREYVDDSLTRLCEAAIRAVYRKTRYSPEKLVQLLYTVFLVAIACQFSWLLVDQYPKGHWTAVSFAAILLGFIPFLASQSQARYRMIPAEWTLVRYRKMMVVVLDIRDKFFFMRIMTCVFFVFVCGGLMSKIIYGLPLAIADWTQFFTIFTMFAHAFARASEPPLPDDGDAFPLQSALKPV